jgi:hypothetical protein
MIKILSLRKIVVSFTLPEAAKKSKPGGVVLLYRGEVKCYNRENERRRGPQ